MQEQGHSQGRILECTSVYCCHTGYTKPHTEMLQDLIVAAVNQVVREVEQTTNAEMQKITGSMGMPGMF